jgi:deoxycytidylate deaminase
MAAITQAARIGVSVKGARLFCTTFPCHICARHIISTGLDEVVFIEPYEKSRTEDLYRDSISVESGELIKNKVNFRSFVGVAPRRYIDFFQLTQERKNIYGTILNMNEIANTPRITRLVPTYLFIEAKVEEHLEQWINSL